MCKQGGLDAIMISIIYCVLIVISYHMIVLVAEVIRLQHNTQIR